VSRSLTDSAKTYIDTARKWGEGKGKEEGARRAGYLKKKYDQLYLTTAVLKEKKRG